MITMNCHESPSFWPKGIRRDTHACTDGYTDIIPQNWDSWIQSGLWMFSKSLITDRRITGTGAYLFQVWHNHYKAKHTALTHILTCSCSSLDVYHLCTHINALNVRKFFRNVNELRFKIYLNFHYFEII
jgi:hypothetical protein